MEFVWIPLTLIGVCFAVVGVMNGVLISANITQDAIDNAQLIVDYMGLAAASFAVTTFFIFLFWLSNLPSFEYDWIKHSFSIGAIIMFSLGVVYFIQYFIGRMKLGEISVPLAVLAISLCISYYQFSKKKK